VELGAVSTDSRGDVGRGGGNQKCALSFVETARFLGSFVNASPCAAFWRV